MEPQIKPVNILILLGKRPGLKMSILGSHLGPDKQTSNRLAMSRSVRAAG